MSESKPQQTATSLEEIVAQLSLETKRIACVVNTLSENVASVMASIAKQDEKSQECAKNTAPEFKTSLVGGAKCEPTPVQFGQINGISLSFDGTQADYPKPGEVGVSVDFNVEIAQPTNLVDALKLAERANGMQYISSETLLLQLQSDVGALAHSLNEMRKSQSDEDREALKSLRDGAIGALIANVLRFQFSVMHDNGESFAEISDNLLGAAGCNLMDAINEHVERGIDEVINYATRELRHRPDEPQPKQEKRQFASAGVAHGGDALDALLK